MLNHDEPAEGIFQTLGRLTDLTNLSLAWIFQYHPELLTCTKNQGFDDTTAKSFARALSTLL